MKRSEGLLKVLDALAARSVHHSGPREIPTAVLVDATGLSQSTVKKLRAIVKKTFEEELKLNGQ